MQMSCNNICMATVVGDQLQKYFFFIQSGGTAVDAVEEAVRTLEDDPLFNAGFGSLLNASGEVECDAMIMDGNTLGTGMCFDAYFSQETKS